MTLRDIANVLARYLGIDSFDPAENLAQNLQRGFREADVRDITTCIQGALQEVYTAAPSWQVERQVSGALRAPANITISVTEYSTACTITGFQSWMAGCTVGIDGDAVYNQLLSATELVRPYMSSTGSRTATVWCDSLAVPAAYCQVLSPIQFPNRNPLPVVNDRQSFMYYNDAPVWSNANGYGYGHAGVVYYDSLSNKTVSEPCVAMCEFETLPGTAPALYLRVNPMPGQAYVVTYTAKLAPPVVTQDDIWDADSPNTDPAVQTFLANAEAVLLPYCLQRFTANPYFSAQGDQLREIARQFQTALKMMERRRPSISLQTAHFAA